MAIQVPRKGNKGTNKECWAGIPGAQNVLTSASAIGSVVTVLSDGSSGGSWTYSLPDADPNFTIVGSELRTAALLPVGTYYVRVKLTYDSQDTWRTYRVVISV